MASYDFDWVDAYSGVTFGGNPCVVVQGADDISAECRMALVRETRLSECAFVVASDKADFGARYYLASSEIPLAGHPTVATVTALIDRGMVALDPKGRADFTLELGAGVVDIAVTPAPDGHVVTMTQPRPVFGAVHDAGAIAALYGLRAQDIADQPQTVSTGSPNCIVLLKDQDALRRAQLDIPAWEKFRAGSGCDFSHAFLTVLGGAERGATFSRLLLAPPEPAEDPFTGSATGCMAAYLWARGHLDGPRFVAEQGHWMDRPGQADVELLGPRDDIAGVNVGGVGKIVMRGTLEM